MLSGNTWRRLDVAGAPVSRTGAGQTGTQRVGTGRYGVPGRRRRARAQEICVSELLDFGVLALGSWLPFNGFGGRGILFEGRMAI